VPLAGYLFGQSGNRHPHTRTVGANYFTLLQQMDLSESAIVARMQELRE
jgi:hypothetical protein